MSPISEARSWLPVNFLFTKTSVSIRWLDFGSDGISDPFFHQTVQRLESGIPPAQERLTELSALLDLAHSRPALRPTGLIFHVSRCGSTWISNALRTGDRVAVLSEARPVGQLFRPGLFRGTPFPPEGWDSARRMMLDAVLKLYAGHTVGQDCRLIIKCHAINLLRIRLIRSIWPSVPCVIVIRDPVEVMISNIAKPAHWLKWRDDLATARKIFGWPDDGTPTMPLEEYCARGIGSFLKAASEGMEANCKVIDYRSIDPSTLRKIGQFFGIDIAPPGSPAFRRVMTLYSKDPEGARRFESDGERKQMEAGAATWQASRHWAEAPYQSLRKLESW